MTTIPNCNKTTIIEALRNGLRLDRRDRGDFRNLLFEFSPDSSSCLCHLGKTRILSVIQGKMGPPKQGRDHQGTIAFKLGFDANLLSEKTLMGDVKYQTVMLTRWLERLFFFGNALDREALCIVAGKMVWHLQVDVRVIDNDGNVTDACALCVLGALAAYRRPHVATEQIHGGNRVRVTTYSTLEREPLPLTLHHFPMSISFAVFKPDNAFVVDPSLQEMSAMAGCIAYVADPQGSILGVQKLYGIPLPSAIITTCSAIALEKAQQIATVLQQALKEHEAKRVQSRVLRSDDAAFMADTTAPNSISMARQSIKTEEIE